MLTRNFTAVIYCIISQPKYLNRTGSCSNLLKVIHHSIGTEKPN